MEKEKLHSICISPQRGQLKQEVEAARLPYEGLFCRVLEGGQIKKGDPVEVMV